MKSHDGFGLIEPKQKERNEVFIHTETGKPAWLIEHDLDVTYDAPDLAHAVTMPSYQFFATHREATAEEISEAAGVRSDGPREVHKKPAPKKAAAKTPKAPHKPAKAVRGAGKAAQPGASPAGADKPASARATPTAPAGAGEPSRPGVRKLFGRGNNK